MQDLYEFGIRLILALQTLSPALDGPMAFLSFLGRVEFYLLALPFVYWNVNATIGVRAITLLLLTDTVTTSLKVLLHEPRPYWLGGVAALQTESSYGIPSGHASGTVAVWGYLAVHIRTRWFRVLAVALVLLIGLSRLYLGVHFPHDVLGGWAVGMAVLGLFLLAERRLGSWWARRGMWEQIGIGLGLSLLPTLAGVVIPAWIAGTPDPPEWANYGVQARDPEHFFVLSGALFGVIAGYALMARRARFATGGGWGQKLLRYGLGLLLVGLVYVGLDLLFEEIAAEGTVISLALTWVRYALTTACAIFAVPWLFLRLRLAQPPPGIKRPGLR